MLACKDFKKGFAGALEAREPRFGRAFFALPPRRGGPMCPSFSRFPLNLGSFPPATRAHTRVRPYARNLLSRVLLEDQNSEPFRIVRIRFLEA